MEDHEASETAEHESIKYDETVRVSKVTIDDIWSESDYKAEGPAVEGELELARKI